MTTTVWGENRNAWGQDVDDFNRDHRNAVEQSNQAQRELAADGVTLGSLLRDLKFRAGDSTDTKIRKVSISIGAFGGGLGAGIPTGGSFAIFGIVGGGAVGMATAEAIIAVKHSIQERRQRNPVR